MRQGDNVFGSAHLSVCRSSPGNAVEIASDLETGEC